MLCIHADIKSPCVLTLYSHSLLMISEGHRGVELSELFLLVPGAIMIS